MLSKDQANIISEEILRQARMARDGAGRTPHIGVVYRCRELAALDPWQQAAVVRHASVAVGRPFMLAALSWIAFAVLYFAYRATHGHQTMPMTAFWLVYFCGFLLIRIAFMRRQIRKIANQVAACVDAPIVPR